MATQLFMSEHHDVFHEKALGFSQKYTLADRAKLSEELQFFLKKYPQAIWGKHPNMSGLLRFWVAKHREFNQVCAELNTTNSAFLEGTITPQFFQQSIAPKINWLLSEFAEHHHIEDHFTFPLLRRAEPKLARGFDILDADHIALTNSLQKVAQASNQFMQCQNIKDIPKLGEHFVQVNTELGQLLKRHLVDEEEIVIPLFLDRGEQILQG